MVRRFFCPAEFWRHNLHRQKMRMRAFPVQCLGFGFKIAVDDNGIALSRVPARQARSSTAYYGRAGVGGDQFLVTEQNPTTIRDFLGIDRAMAVAQTAAIESRPKLAPSRQYVVTL